jgi:hypothetical protein
MNINTHLADALNLAPIEEPEEQMIQPVEVTKELTTQEVFDQVDKIAAALPAVNGLDSSDEELDELANIALEAHKEIMNLGFNVDMKHAGEVLSVASNMLAHAITAKTNKIQKKLKMVDLQLKKLRIDQNEKAQNPAAPAGSIPGKATEIDRNELLLQLLNRNSKNGNSDK